MDEQPGEVLFRVSKRRKVVRKPAHQASLDEAPSPRPTEADTAITEHAEESYENGVGGVTRIQRKAQSKKYGIAFSSADSSRNTGNEYVEEQALVPVNEDGVSEPPKIDRFVKPTGNVRVTEDKHMMAYVDSKLAEIRPAADTPPTSTKEHEGVDSPLTEANSETHESNFEARSAEKTPQGSSGPTTYQQAQERSRKVYQRPTKRRPPPAREQTDVNRDSMIEQIMGENQIPHYARPVPQTRHEGGDDMDNDTAAAEAFKAQLLADLARSKRRQPLSKSSKTVSTGPKLGGSRSQREKMRALEEAKASAGKK